MIYDESGRVIAPDQTTDSYVRPMGPWDTNKPSLTVICGWCPDVRERTLAAQKVGTMISHGICPACAVKLEDLALTDKILA